MVTSGRYEGRDVLGSLRYAAQRRDTATMRVSLFSRCLGANSTFAAMRQDPAAFDGVHSLVACQPVSDRAIMARMLDLLGAGAHHLDELDRRVKIGTSLGFGERPDASWARHVRIPTYLYGVHDDTLTVPADLEQMHDVMDIKDNTWPGYATRPPAGTATWSSNGAPSRCWTGGIAT